MHFRKQTMSASDKIIWGLIGTAITLFTAWCTHIIVCFQTAQWGFLIAGAIFFPIAMAHGVGIWFGAW